MASPEIGPGPILPQAGLPAGAPVKKEGSQEAASVDLAKVAVDQQKHPATAAPRPTSPAPAAPDVHAMQTGLGIYKIGQQIESETFKKIAGDKLKPVDKDLKTQEKIIKEKKEPGGHSSYMIVEFLSFDPTNANVVNFHQDKSSGIFTKHVDSFYRIKKPSVEAALSKATEGKFDLKQIIEDVKSGKALIEKNRIGQILIKYGTPTQEESQLRYSIHIEKDKMIIQKESVYLGGDFLEKVVSAKADRQEISGIAAFTELDKMVRKK